MDAILKDTFDTFTSSLSLSRLSRDFFKEKLLLETIFFYKRISTRHISDFEFLINDVHPQKRPSPVTPYLFFYTSFRAEKGGQQT